MINEIVSKHDYIKNMMSGVRYSDEEKDLILKGLGALPENNHSMTLYSKIQERSGHTKYMLICNICGLVLGTTENIIFWINISELYFNIYYNMKIPISCSEFLMSEALG